MAQSMAIYGDQAPGYKPLFASPNTATGGPMVNQDHWATFFGEARGNFPTNPYDASKRSTWVLPESYLYNGGRNDYIKNLLEMHIYTADSFYTEDLAPLQYTDDMSVEWNKWEFSPRFVDQVPELGVARLVDSKRSGGRATFERRGIGLYLSHGFMNSAQGRMHYKANLEQMAQSVIETNNFGVIYSYLTCDEPGKHWLADWGNDLGNSLHDILKTEVELWDIFKSQKNGAEILDARVTETMARYRAEADTWIVPKKVGLWYTIIPEDKKSFWEGDRQRAITNVIDGKDYFRYFDNKVGARVYLCRQYYVDENQRGTLDILKFPTQNGEFFVMFDDKRGGDHQDYSTEDMSIKVYDEDVDAFSKLTASFALDNCGRFDPETGDMISINDLTNLQYNPPYNAVDKKDPFHFTDENGNDQPARLFGNINYQLSDIWEWTQTAYNHLFNKNVFLNNSDKKNTDPLTILMKGRNALNIIEKFTVDAGTKFSGFITQLIASNAEYMVASPNPRSGIAEFGANALTGTFDVPNLNTGADDSGIKYPLPPLFGSFPGFKAISELSSAGLAAAYGYNATLCREVEEFTTFFENLAASLTRLCPGHPMLQPKHASSWWRYPNAATVLFENLFGTFRNPVLLADESEDDEEAGGRRKQFIGADLKKLSAARKDSVVANKDGIDADLLNVFASNKNTALTVLNNLGLIGDDLKLVASPKDVDFTFVENMINLILTDKLRATELADKIEEAKIRGIIVFLLGSLSKIEESDLPKLNIALKESLKDIIIVGSAANDVPTIVGGTIAGVNAVSKLLRTKPEFFNRSAAGTTKVLKQITEAIDSLAKSSQKNKGTVLELFGDADANKGRASYGIPAAGGQFRRAPLVMTPGIFKTLINKEKSLKIIPVDPENPLNAIPFSRWNELADQLSSNNPSDWFGIHASLQPEPSAQKLIGSRVGAQSPYADINRLSVVQNIRSGLGSGSSSSSSISYQPSAQALIGAELRAPKAASSIRGGSRKSASAAKSSTVRDYLKNDQAMAAQVERAESTRVYASGISDSVDDVLLACLGQADLRAQLQEVDQAADSEITALLAKVFLLCPTNKRNWKAMLDQNVLCPSDFLILRPHQRYDAYACIKVKAGASTAVTFMGNSIFTLGDNSVIQAHTGTFTYYSRTVVFTPKNVFVVRNAFIEGYNGGCGVTPYKMDTYDPAVNQYGEGSKGDSIFVVMVPRGGNTYPSPMSITGRWTMFDRSVFSYSDETLHYSTAYFYNKKWGWLNRELGIGSQYDEMFYINDRCAPNGVVHEGHTLHYNSRTKVFDKVRQSRGHWKSAHTYPRCGEVRAGGYKAFEVQDWTTGYSLV